VACARLGVSFIGAEIDETYLREAVARTKATMAGRVAKVRSLKAEARSLKPGGRNRRTAGSIV
jgi:hypothetical protein